MYCAFGGRRTPCDNLLQPKMSFPKSSLLIDAERHCDSPGQPTGTTWFTDTEEVDGPVSENESSEGDKDPSLQATHLHIFVHQSGFKHVSLDKSRVTSIRRLLPESQSMSLAQFASAVHELPSQSCGSNFLDHIAHLLVTELKRFQQPNLNLQLHYSQHYCMQGTACPTLSFPEFAFLVMQVMLTNKAWCEAVLPKKPA